MKKIRRILSLMLASIIILVSSKPIFAEDMKDIDKNVYGQKIKFYPNEAFKLADMDEVIFYTLNQIPITKDDIITGKFESKMQIKMKADYEKMTVSVPSGRTKAIGKEEISVPRYSQTNEILWLPAKDAAKYASSIEAGLTEQVLAFAAGFIPHIGWVIALPWGIKLLIQSSIASQIREFSDDGKGVEITRIISNYGGSMTVKAWNGKNITLLKPKDESSGHMFTKIKVSYSFK